MTNAATALPWQTLLDANLMKRHDRVPAVGCLIWSLVTHGEPHKPLQYLGDYVPICPSVTGNDDRVLPLDDDRQRTHEDSERPLDIAAVSFSLGMSHFRFTLVSPPRFSHGSAYRGDRCASVLVMPARLRDAISGILAGGIPGFGTTTFLLGTSRSSG